MDLAEHQRALLDLIVGPTTGEAAAAPATSDYLTSVAESDALPVVQGIAASWRAFTLRRLSPLTFAALERCGLLDEVLERLGRRPVSPFLRLLAGTFQDVAVEIATERSADGHDLIAAIATFEHSVVLPAPSGDHVVIDWPCAPDVALRRLLDGQDPFDLPRAPHRTTAPAGDPTALRIECTDAAH